MKNKLLLFLLLLTSIYAKAIHVEGTVYDQNKETIVGATIKLKDHPKIGVLSDLNGKFSLSVSDVKNGVLIVSYVGCKTKYVPLNGRTILDIVLESEVKELDEVVVVGYGSMKKSDLTGSVSSVKTSDVEASQATSFDKMLQGKAAGVSVSTGSAAPGGSASVRIRGTSSLRGNNSPLYVIDGNIVSGLGDTMNPMGQGNGSGNSRVDDQNPLAFISPQDIESIEILKDASATAIYGSQGSNGVVLITTKHGKSGKPLTTISSTLTVSNLAREIPMLNTSDYLDFRNSKIFIGDDGIPLSIDQVMPVDWQKESTRAAWSQNYRASVSGKSQRTSYYLSAGYADQQGVIRKTSVSKYDIRFNLDQEIGKYVSLSSNSSFGSINTSMTSGTDKLANLGTSIIRHMISFRPYRTSVDDGSSYDEDITAPDVWFTDYDDNSKENTFTTDLSLDVKPLNWLTLRLKGGLVYRQKERSMWYGKKTFLGAQTNGKAGYSDMSSKIYDAEALLLFNPKLKKSHSFEGTLGVVYNSKRLQQNNITGENFFSEDLRADGISQAATFYPFLHVKTNEQLFSILARGVYNYADRYVVTATFRADGSSKFAKNNRFSYFPSFAFAWRVNQEKFMSKFDKISNLKFRLGWGQVGNQAIAAYQTLPNYSNNNYAKPDGAADPGIVSSLIPNPDLKWETSEQYNIGLDLGLFNQRLTFTADAYIKNTKDLLQQISLPTASGYNTMWINNGKIENKGLELSFEAVPISKKKLTWTIGGNISFVSNKIKSLGMSPGDFGMVKNVSGYFGENVGNNNDSKFPANVFLANHSVGLFMGYQTHGIMQEEYYNSTENQNNPLKMKGTAILPGDVFYVDQNGDGTIDDSDRVILGNPNPDFTYALTTALEYKNWTLSMAFTGVSGNDIINANLINETDVKNGNYNIRKDAFFQAWTSDNKSNTYPRLGYQPKGVLSDRFIENGSYLKLSQLSLSYNFKLKKSAFLRSLTLNATANNLFTLTSYSGYDPDVNTFSNDADRMGIDLVSYPSARSFTFGIIANF